MKLEGQNPMFSNDSIRLVSYCPLCNTQYNPLSARIVEERDDAHLIHIKCKKCNSSIVALVLSSGVGISSVGLITDLSEEDVIRFKDGNRVNNDDVLNLYSLLRSSTDVIKYIKSNN